MKMKIKKNFYDKGDITPALLLITSAFIIVIYGLLFALGLQVDFSNRNVGSEQALHIAEAGINYYKWHLAHDPADFSDGTGQEGGTYTHDFTDPQGAQTGKYSLQITPPENGSSIVTIRSTGWSNQFPNIKRTIKAQYGVPSMSRFSFLSNASSWYGSGITVNGEVHSNNGIRMDGNNTSVVSSFLPTYICGSETGCYDHASCHSPCTWSSQSGGTCRCPGVWGAGGDSGLWQFPSTYFDFDNISFDYTSMQTSAGNDGLELPPSNARGYHLLFLSNGTLRVNKVLNTSYINGYSVAAGCTRLYQTITSETFYGSYNVSDVPIIFAEDDLWVEGTVRGRTTVAAVRFPLQTSTTYIWIPNSISYTTYNGSDVLGLIAQTDIYFTKGIPNNFKVDAVLMAQKGTIIRHGYFDWCGGNSGAVKNSLTINGSIISFNKSYWNFGTGPTSGFVTRQINYDTNVLYAPPPFFPTSGQYEFISWSEE